MPQHCCGHRDDTMDWEEFKRHKPYAGNVKPSMLRRRIGHDYTSRRIYLITITVEHRRPLLGHLHADGNDAHVMLTPLGKRVEALWEGIHKYHPEIRVLNKIIMPDHLHGILFVERNMETHLGVAIKGFKNGCNKAYRELLPAAYAECATLWTKNYNDLILSGENSFERWANYLNDNPRRLAVKRAHPEFFRVRFGITVGSNSYAAIGNRFLLNYPEKKLVQCSRSLNDTEIAKLVEDYLAEARSGVVPVSPAISPGEQAVMRAVLDNHLPLIFLTPWGFNSFSKPGHQYFEACAQGRFLILAPWEHHNTRQQLTREMCLSLNAMALEICEM